MFVFFLWNSPFLGVFGWVCDTLLRASLVGPCSLVNDGNMCTLWRRRCKSHSSNWRHERRRAQKRHLATKRLETLEKWRRRKPVSLNMEFNAPRKRIGCGDVANLGNAHVWRTTLRIHSSSCATRNWFQKKNACGCGRGVATGEPRRSSSLCRKLKSGDGPRLETRGRPCRRCELVARTLGPCWRSRVPWVTRGKSLVPRRRQVASHLETARRLSPSVWRQTLALGQSPRMVSYACLPCGLAFRSSPKSWK